MNPNADETKLKYATDMVFEDKVKTMLQPIARGRIVFTNPFRKVSLKFGFQIANPTSHTPKTPSPSIINWFSPQKCCIVKTKLSLKNRFEPIS